MLQWCPLYRDSTVAMCPGTKFQSIQGTFFFGELVFGTKFVKKKKLYGGVLGKTQPENNLFQVKNPIIWLISGSLWVVSAGFRWSQVIPWVSKCDLLCSVLIRRSRPLYQV